MSSLCRASRLSYLSYCVENYSAGMWSFAFVLLWNTWPEKSDRKKTRYDFIIIIYS